MGIELTASAISTLGYLTTLVERREARWSGVARPTARPLASAGVRWRRRWGPKQKGQHRVSSIVVGAQYGTNKLECVWVEEAINEDIYPSVGLTWRLQRGWSCFRRCTMEIKYPPHVCLRPKVRKVTVEAIGTLLDGCVTRSPSKDVFDGVRQAHRFMILCCLG